MDKTKWMRLIQWKFGGCGIHKSLPVPGKIDEGYVRLLTENIKSNHWKDNIKKIYRGLNGRVSRVFSPFEVLYRMNCRRYNATDHRILLRNIVDFEKLGSWKEHECSGKMGMNNPLKIYRKLRTRRPVTAMQALVWRIYRFETLLSASSKLKPSKLEVYSHDANVGFYCRSPEALVFRYLLYLLSSVSKFSKSAKTNWCQSMSTFLHSIFISTKPEERVTPCSPTQIVSIVNEQK